MIYIFRSPFKLSDGTVIQKDDAVFVDNPDATDEVAVEVKRRLAAEEAKPEKKKKNE
jgi:hypothetical protein